MEVGWLLQQRLEEQKLVLWGPPSRSSLPWQVKLTMSFLGLHPLLSSHAEISLM